MPLINIQTDFKSLSYGNDRPGQDSSNEPYIIAPIPTGEIPPNSPDFILRNASGNFLENILKLNIGGANVDSESNGIKPDSILGDLKRIRKFFFKKGITPTTKGLLFTVKQNLLEFQNPSIPEGYNLLAKESQRGIGDVVGGGVSSIVNFSGIPNILRNIYVPTSTIAQVAVNAFGGHLNKTGLNPFSLSYYQGGDKNRYYGFASNPDNNTGDTNRLALLRLFKLSSGVGIKEYGQGQSGLDALNSFVSFKRNAQTNAKTLNIIPSIGTGNFAKDTILQYLGGPGDFLLFTRIRRWEYTNKYSLSNFTGNGSTSAINDNNRVLTFDQNILLAISTDTSALGNSSSDTDAINAITVNIAGQSKNTTVHDFRRVIAYNKDFGLKNTQVLPSTPYNSFNREATYKTSKTFYRQSSGFNISDDFTNPNFTFSADEINTKPATAPVDDGNDLIDFKIEILNNDNTTANPQSNWILYFRSYIRSLSDTFKPDWQSYKYVGRAENFYKYGGFTRDINLSFDIYAHSRAEMGPIYQKLNYLLGTTAPSYSSIGLMRGVIVKLTVGDYIRDMPGIINNLALKPSFEAGWDINRNQNGVPFKTSDTSVANGYRGQLPRLIDVDMSFNPIHTFAPQLGKPFVGSQTLFNTP